MTSSDQSRNYQGVDQIINEDYPGESGMNYKSVRTRTRNVLTPSEIHSNIDSTFGASIFGKNKTNKSITVYVT